jgi:hypothetical protein
MASKSHFFSFSDIDYDSAGPWLLPAIKIKLIVIQSCIYIVANLTVLKLIDFVLQLHVSVWHADETNHLICTIILQLVLDCDQKNIHDGLMEWIVNQQRNKVRLDFKSASSKPKQNGRTLPLCLLNQTLMSFMECIIHFRDSVKGEDVN